MARNGTGTFNRLFDWVNDRDAHVNILAARMDSEFDGMATALTQSIASDGQTPTSARIPFATGLSVAAGSVGTPSISVIGDTNTGLYSAGADTLTVTCGGTKVCEFGAAGFSFAAGSVSAPGFSIVGDVNTGLYSTGADKLTITCGGTKVGEFGTAGLVAANVNATNCLVVPNTGSDTTFTPSSPINGTLFITVQDVGVSDKLMIWWDGQARLIANFPNT